MMAKAKDVIGLPVITLEQGDEVDQVKDVIYDPQENRVRALLIDEGGWFSDAKILLLQDVQSIGEDAVIIENKQVIRKAADVKEKIARIAKDDEYLTQTKIVTEEGNELGNVTDIHFDTDTGAVEEFEVSQGLVKDVGSGKKRVKIDDIVTVGRDATIVRGHTKVDFEEQAKSQGIRGAVESTRQKTRDAVESTKEKTPKVMEKVRSGAGSLVQDVKDTAREIDAKAREKINETRNDPAILKRVDRMKKNAKTATGKIRQKASQAARSAKKNMRDRKDAPPVRAAVELPPGTTIKIPDKK